jgi:polar amino acid transport system substrate-binding protein
MQLLVHSAYAETAFNEIKNQGVVLVADEWCPQHCPNNPVLKGYIVDTIEAAFKIENIPVTIVYAPWLRAVRDTISGQYDGLLTPTVENFPEFYYGQESIGVQEYCMYVKENSSWKYRHFSDFKGYRVAFLADSGFGELDGYFKKNNKTIKQIEFADSDNYVKRIFKFLSMNRADIVIITSDVYRYYRLNNLIPDRYKNAGCLGAKRLAVGFSPKNRDRIKLISSILDSGVRKIRNNGTMKRIHAQYGLFFD